ncbi:hypothetical protein ABKN59_006741 [Abortiporus biennis]
MEASQQSFGLFEPVPPSSRHSTAASIWAPQPQPSDTTWTRVIDSIARIDQPHHGEDVFGPIGYASQLRKKDVGAIGDGRKKSVSDPDETHVEQLLRTLNLNSPTLPPPPPLFGGFLSSTASPELSPISTTSALLTPTDLSPAKPFDPKLGAPYDFGANGGPQVNGLLFETASFNRYRDTAHANDLAYGVEHRRDSNGNSFPFFDSYNGRPPPSPATQGFAPLSPIITQPRDEPTFVSPWGQQTLRSSQDWARADDRRLQEPPATITEPEQFQRSFSVSQFSSTMQSHEPINFLSLLHPSSAPPYPLFVSRIIKSSDQQASIFLQQKLKVADAEERGKIVDAICARGYEMMAHRFGNWAVQRCLEATGSVDERRKIVACMRGRVVDLATNCYGCHVLQKALDCEEDVRLLIVSELLLGDPAQTLVNKHASHVWSKIMELTWTPPAPPIFAYVNKSLKGKWASLACHETGSLVVQHAFENLEESAKDGIVDELLNQGSATFSEVAKSQWGSYCIQHILEHGSSKHRNMALEHLVSGLLEYATNEQGAKSVTKALKEGGKDTLNCIIKRMCEPAKGGRRAMIVDLALSVTGSQLIASVLPNADKDQRALLYDSIRGHIVTLRGCKTGSKVIWLFDRMRAYYGY